MRRVSRYQRTPGEFDFRQSPRGGVFVTAADPRKWFRPNWEFVGGQHLVAGLYAPKNPLIVKSRVNQALFELLPVETARQLIADRQFARIFLSEHIGLSDADIALLEPGYAHVERIVAELAKAAGYDAVEARGGEEIFVLNPSALRVIPSPGIPAPKM